MGFFFFFPYPAPIKSRCLPCLINKVFAVDQRKSRIFSREFARENITSKSDRSKRYFCLWNCFLKLCLLTIGLFQNSDDVNCFSFVIKFRGTAEIHFITHNYEVGKKNGETQPTFEQSFLRLCERKSFIPRELCSHSLINRPWYIGTYTRKRFNNFFPRHNSRASAMIIAYVFGWVAFFLLLT